MIEALPKPAVPFSQRRCQQHEEEQDKAGLTSCNEDNLPAKIWDIIVRAEFANHCEMREMGN
jgi:hypothetical protein